LGAGAHGTVYKGKWSVFTVAAKKFPISANEATQDSIQREIKVLGILTYRHVIQFYGTVYHKGHLVLLTDLAERGSLASAIRNGIKDWSTKERFAREMLLGLAYIHSKGVLHLDLKSENVLLSHSMEVKLCDFGCSTIKTTSATKSTESKKGTVRWIAPEIFVPKPKYSTKSDMYSLGMVMWEMAANCTTPFKDHRNSPTIILLVKEGMREELPDDTPVEYRNWVERCWDKDPSKRPEAMEYFQEAERAEKRDGIPDDTLETDKTSEGRDMTNLISFCSDGNSVLSHLANEENSGSKISSNTSMVTGRGVEKSNVETVEWYTKAANQGDPGAQYNFGMMYDRGQGVGQSDAKAIEWYTKAANQGNANAQNNLGWMYRDGRGVEPSDEKAVEWYTKAANQGHADAQFNLGWMYGCGRGVNMSDEKAVEWYTKAARQGVPGAQTNLGWMYEIGRGVEQSDSKAIELYTKAANQGDATARANLERMYKNGRRVE
ncbi:hypothetical protein BGW42_000237, partial [Actinomortierella wolfii]